jgi:carbamoyltransferase
VIALGLNSFFEHPSAALIVDGSLVFAVEEERLSGIKGGKRYSPHSFTLPFRSLVSAFRHAGITANDVDVIGYSYDPRRHLAASLGSLVGQRLSSFREEMAAFNGLANIRAVLSGRFDVESGDLDVIPVGALSRKRLHCFEHHDAHAASSYLLSGFTDALVLTIDGSGENACTRLAIGASGKMRTIARFNIPHSLGMVYSFFTRHLGFTPFKDEYKVMGLAAHGRPTLLANLEKVIRCDDRGFYRVDSRALHDLPRLFGPARQSGDELLEHHADLAASLQRTLEQIVTRLVIHFQKVTGATRLCMAGGVALNCVMNQRIHSLGIFDEIFVPPGADDAGTSIGAAALAYQRASGRYEGIACAGPYLGPDFDVESAKSFLESAGLAHVVLAPDDLAREVAELVDAGFVGGVFQGRLEFGARALGNRSLIASPRDPDMLERINSIKGREQFRPIAPVVTEAAFSRYFEGKPDKYMLFTVNVKDERKAEIPAVTHLDGTARAQTVSQVDNPLIYRILTELERVCGIPVLVNTSLNFDSRPIIADYKDAVRYYLTTPLDFMILGPMLLRKPGVSPSGGSAGGLASRRASRTEAAKAPVE